MFSHPIALENTCERKGTINGHNRGKLTNLHSTLNCDLGVIFSEFIQLPTPMCHALLMINRSSGKF